MEKHKRWEIAVCPRGTVHLHYGTGSLHILKQDFSALADELRHLAVLLDAAPQAEQSHDKKGLPH
jgi:hypothetical protein